MKMREPSEEDEQVAVVNWLWNRGFFVFHIPNGVKSSVVRGARLKKAGLISGMPDLQIILNDESVIWVEMKKRVGGKLSDNQIVVHEILKRMNHIVITAKGAKDAIDQLQPLLRDRESACSQEDRRQGKLFFPALLGEMLLLQEQKKRKPRGKSKGDNAS